MRRALPALVLAFFLVACGGGGGGGGEGDGVVVTPPTPGGLTGDARVLAANDLGMHCMDREFSVFCILPPFNVIQAQVVLRGSGGPRVLAPGEVDVTYEAVADATGSINSTSLAGKTGFWDHADALFGVTLPAGQGLTGLRMPADAPTPGPQAFAVEADTGWFQAFGIPMTPVDDAGRTNPYSMFRIAARDATTGNLLATTDIVVPVATETDCRNCHLTGKIAASAAGTTWSGDADPEIQSKRNILILHDANQGTDLLGSQPVLCAGCHYSPALDLAGTGPTGSQVGKPTFSAVMHDYHGRQTDATGALVFPPAGSAIDTCYQCHPGSVTQCLRGAMASGGMECRDCHGDMLAVGGPRQPWVDLPQCGSCHTGDANSHVTGANVVPAPDGIRLMQAWRTGDPDATPIVATNRRFAEGSGKLYRKSEGHGGLACTACHGSPHAIWPNANLAANDNVAARRIQGHAGKIMECTACHAPGSLSPTMNGPHGMHPVNDARWIDETHGHYYERDHASCTSCHGADLTGTVLSRAAAARDLTVEDAGHVHFNEGQAVGCTHCHGNPASGHFDD